MQKQTLEYSKDHNIEEDLKGGGHIKLPPLPQSLRQGEYAVQYEGDQENYHQRIFFKLVHMWLFWANIVQNEEIIKLFDQEHDKDSDIYKMKNILLDFMDHLGSLLAMTRVDQEIAWLRMNDKDLKEHEDEAQEESQQE